MGVKDLWQLLGPVGRRVSIETLEGKTVAVDVSIWITQFVKAMRDDDGKMIKNAHLIGTIRRILRLLYHRIKPIFVFDGATPLLKLQTVRSRKAVRDRQENNKRTIAQKIFLSQMKQRAIQLKLAASKAAANSSSTPRSPGASVSSKTALGAATEAASSSNSRFSSSFKPLDAAKSTTTGEIRGLEENDDSGDVVAAASEPVQKFDDTISCSTDRRPSRRAGQSSVSFSVTADGGSRNKSGGRLHKGRSSYDRDQGGKDDDEDSFGGISGGVSRSWSVSSGAVGASASTSTAAGVSVNPLRSTNSYGYEDNDDSDDDTRDVQWVDGYENLRGERLKGTAAADDEDVDDGDDDEEMHWNIPEDSAEIDIDVLASLPAHLRKNMIEDARRRERRRSRNSYIPVAANPELYSQTQLANFLKGSKLNKRIYDAQKVAEAGTELSSPSSSSSLPISQQSKGRSIAAEGGRKYVMIRPTQKSGSVEAGSAGTQAAAAGSSGTGVNKRGSDDDDDEQSSFPQQQRRGPKRIIGDDDEEGEEAGVPSTGGGGGFLADDDNEDPDNNNSGGGGGFFVDDDDGGFNDGRGAITATDAGAGGCFVDDGNDNEYKPLSQRQYVTNSGGEFLLDDYEQSAERRGVLRKKKATTVTEAAASASASVCSLKDRSVVGWSCSECTYNNTLGANECLLCSQPALVSGVSHTTAVLPISSSSSSGSSTDGSSSSSHQQSSSLLPLQGHEAVEILEVDQHSKSATSMREVDNSSCWTCTTCTLINSYRLSVCEACGGSRHDHNYSAATAAAVISQTVLAESLRSSSTGAGGAAAPVASSSKIISSSSSSSSSSSASLVAVVASASTSSFSAPSPAADPGAKPAKKTVLEIANELNTLDDSDDGNDDFDDVAWESADEENPSSLQFDKPSSPLLDEGSSIARDNDEIAGLFQGDDDNDDDSIVEDEEDENATSAGGAAGVGLDFSRAISTAGRMADWAGRAVERALMEHMKKNQQSPHIPPPKSQLQHSHTKSPAVKAVVNGSEAVSGSFSTASAAATPQLKSIAAAAVSISGNTIEGSPKVGVSNQHQHHHSNGNEKEKERSARSLIVVTNIDESTSSIGAGIPSPDPPEKEVIVIDGDDKEVIEMLGTTNESREGHNNDVEGDVNEDDEDIGYEYGYGDSIADIDKSELRQLQVGADAFTISSIASPSIPSTSISDVASVQANSSSSATDAAAEVDVQELQRQLREEEKEEFAARRARKAALRDAETMTDEMRDDLMHLLNAFGLPYIVAPFEAEAQCAVLEELKLVDGIITEDSDAFLFGAQAVYKNLFSDKKFVEVYLAADIKKELGLDREELVALAFFLGSDYTEGVTGVGIVNAVEIVQAFPMKFTLSVPVREEDVFEDEKEEEERGGETGGPVEGLKKFRQWLEGYDFADTVRAKQSASSISPAKKGRRSTAPSKKRKKKMMKAHGKTSSKNEGKRRGKGTAAAKGATNAKKKRKPRRSSGGSDSDSDFVDSDDGEEQSAYSEDRKSGSASDEDAGDSSSGSEESGAEEEEEGVRKSSSSSSVAVAVADDILAISSEEPPTDEDKNLALFGEKHKGARARWSVKQNFPDARVAEAYLKPSANRDTTKFEWPLPKLNRIRDYCQEILGWTESELDAQIDPVIERYTTKAQQMRIDSYFFAYENDQRFAKIASTRLGEAVVKKTGNKRAIVGGGSGVTDIALLSKKEESKSSPNPRKKAKGK